MKFFRSHITRFGSSGLLIAGLLLYLLRPVNTDHSAKRFTNWLESEAYTSEVPGLKEKLNRLQQSGASVNDLIEKVSQIISDVESPGELPGETPADVSSVYQALLMKWSQYQTGSTMAGLPVPGTVKAPIFYQLDKFTGSEIKNPHPATPPVQGAYSATVPQIFPTSYTRQPLASGRAIGAP